MFDKKTWNREYAVTHREQKNAQQRRWKAAHKEQVAAKDRENLPVKLERARLARQEIITFLGGICVRCGFDDRRALQIDHKNGGGNKERRVLPSCSPKFYRKIRDNLNDYQILCANCNWIKRAENKEYATRNDRQHIKNKSRQGILYK